MWKALDLIGAVSKVNPSAGEVEFRIEFSTEERNDCEGPCRLMPTGDERVVGINVARVQGWVIFGCAVIFRMCIDYRGLSKIDLYSGCHQMRVHEDEIIKTVYTKSKEEHESHLKMKLELLNKEKCQQGQSGVKMKLFGSYRNNMGNEPILALPEGLDNFIVIRGARVRMLT
ncbi:hypothetical protein Tco_0301077 [Tanacetum coccineum]